MTEPLLRSATPVLLAGGGAIAPAALAAVRPFCDKVVAADGGADGLAAFGVTPDLILGDLDSLHDPASWSARGVAVHRIAEQDSTDFEKAVTRIDAPLVLGVGFTGKRLDHTLAVIASLAKFGPRGLIVAGEEDCAFALPLQCHLDLPAGAVLSLVPMAEIAGLSSTNLRWPIDGLNFAPMGQGGTSNEALGPVSMAFDRLGMVGLVALEHLPAVVAAIEA